MTYRDGAAVWRARLADLVSERDGLEQELAKVQREIAGAETSLGLVEPARERDCLWVLALPIGIIGLSIWGLCGPAFTQAKAESAKVGAEAIKHAVEQYRNTEGPAGCPVLERLVATKKIDAKKVEDAWGRPYLVECNGEEVHVTSAGEDGYFFSRDDIREDFRPRGMGLNH